MSTHYNKLGKAVADEEDCAECNPLCECGEEVKEDGDLCGKCQWIMKTM